MENICEWENCKEIGKFKAPIEKDNSKKFRLLCLEHIKEFNKSWNYFADMDDKEIQNFVKSDLTWHKPTKSFSSSENFFKIRNFPLTFLISGEKARTNFCPEITPIELKRPQPV